MTLLGNGTKNTTIEGNYKGNVVYITANWVNVTGFKIINSGPFSINAGICLYGVHDCSIKYNLCLNNENGIYLDQSSSNLLADNTCNSNNDNGIHLQNSHLNSINNNFCQNNNRYGIYLGYSNSVIIINNTMVTCGLNIEGHAFSHWDSHTIYINNTINGKPVYYWKNVTEKNVPYGAGQVILINCSKIVIENQNCSDGSIGIYSGFSNNITIKNNNCNMNNMFGIELLNSKSNTIINNTCTKNTKGILLDDSKSNNITNNICKNNEYGINLHNSNLNTLINNTCSNNNKGILLRNSDSNIIINNICNFNDNNGFYLHYSNLNIIKNNICSSNMFQSIVLDNSNQNTLENNNISNNWMGISLESNSNSNIILKNIILNNSEFGLFIGDDSNNNNIIYYNQFISNNNQVINRGKNFWNNSLQEGNYWSDYYGLDNGFNGRIAGDGIGDTNIPHNKVDFYPFVNHELNHNNEENDTIDSEDNNIFSGINLALCRFIIIFLIIIIIIIILLLKKRKNQLHL